MSLTSKLLAGERALDRLSVSQQRLLLRAYSSTLKEIRGLIATGYARYGGEYSDWVKYGRLASLEKEISREIAKLTGKNAVTLKKGLGETFMESYYRTAYALESTVRARLGFGQLNPKTIEAAIINPLDRVGFLARNRDNQALLTRQLKEQLTQGLIRGESYQSTALRIKQRMDVGATNVLRIVQTENHRCQTLGRLASFDQAEEAGVIMVRVWVATLDGNTRDEHQDMDGVEANEDNLFPSPIGLVEGPGLSGDPSFDINCRCTVRGEIKDYEPKLRRAREVEGERGELIQYKTYNQWKDGRIN